MVMTILEARVLKENWTALEQAFAQASKEKDAGLMRTYLVHATREEDLWRIISIWTSREALAEMRKSTETPRGILIFRSAHSEPMLSVFDIVGEINAER